MASLSATLRPEEKTIDSVEASPGAPARHRALPTALLVAGLAIVGWLLWTAGWPAVRANLALIGWRFPALVALYAAAEAAFAAGWMLVLPSLSPRRAFGRVFAAYIGGDAINYATPVNVAGEPLKARLLSDLVSGREAAASLALYKHAELLAQSVFVAAGVAVALRSYALPRAVALLAAAGAAALVLAFGFMTWALRRGSFAPILGRLTRIGWLGRRLSRFEGGARDVDASIRAFYAQHPMRFALASLFCLAGWCGGLLETYLVLGLLTHATSPRLAFSVEGLAMVAGNMLLFMPARVGSAEGSRVAVFLLLGLPAAQGVAYGLVRRARELVWVALGALVLLKRHVKP